MQLFSFCLKPAILVDAMRGKAGTAFYNTFRFIGYAFLIISLLSIVFIIVVSVPTLDMDDAATLIILLIYIGAFFLAHQRPFLTGFMLITVTIGAGVPPAITNYFWVGALYGLPPLVAGISFIMNGIYLWQVDREIAAERSLTVSMMP